MRQIVLDTETTGLETRDGHRILEIGCLELIERRPTGNNLHIYLNPERDIDEGALRVHGITQAFLADKPLFADIADQVVDYLRDAEVIIHNAPFDVGFLDYELSLLGRNERIGAISHVTDSLVMAKKMYPGQKNSLDALCRRLGVDNSNRELHGALLDARLLADVYLLMTGGQSRLFQESNNTDGQGSETRRQVSHAPLKVISASADEMTEHDNYLQAMPGDAVWQ